MQIYIPCKIKRQSTNAYNSPFSDDNFGVNPNAFASVSSYESPTFPDQYASTVPLTPQKYSSSSYIPDEKVSYSDTSSLHQKDSPSSLQLSQPLFTDQTASSSSGEHSPQFIDDHASTSSHPFMTATVPPPPAKKSSRLAAATKVTDTNITIPRSSTRRPKKGVDDTPFTTPKEVKKT